MKIAIANDHRGYILKKQLVLYLEREEIEVINLGTDTEDAVDYPVYAKRVGEAILEGKADFGILICGTGIGMSIAANKMKGIRCAKVGSLEDARLTRLDNDANVIALSYLTKKEDAIQFVETFIQTETSSEERHVRRRKLIEEMEHDA